MDKTADYTQLRREMKNWRTELKKFSWSATELEIQRNMKEDKQKRVKRRKPNIGLCGILQERIDMIQEQYQKRMAENVQN